MGNPKTHKAAMQAERNKQIKAANQRTAAANARIEAAKKK